MEQSRESRKIEQGELEHKIRKGKFNASRFSGKKKRGAVADAAYNMRSPRGKTD